MTVVPNHRKDVDMYLLLILDLSGKALATLHVWISVEKLQLWGTSELTKKRERERAEIADVYRTKIPHVPLWLISLV